MNNKFIIHPINIILLFFINTTSLKTRAGLSPGFIETAVSLLIISAFALSIFYLFKNILKDSFKAGIVLSFILIVTLFFRDMVEFILYFKINEALPFTGEYFIAIIISAAALIVLITFLKRAKRNLITVNVYFNLITIIFLITEVISFVTSEAAGVSLKEKIEITSNEEVNEKPDIYFILLDGYTGFKGLKKLWNYDNNELKKFFNENDIFFAENAKCVYNVTNYSMVSTFNMTELIYSRDELYAKENYLALAEYMKENPVVKFFSDAGYEFYNFTFWNINDKKKYYEDIYFLRRGNIYQARTLYGHLYKIYNENTADMAVINTGIFNKLVEIHREKSDKPKFVYAHITMPHPPYYFDAEGNRRDFLYSNDSKNMHKYLGQLKHTNTLIINTVKKILSTREEPVIIIQSDHGFRSYEGKDKMEIELSVLNCFYFPDKDYSMLNDSLKTINTFRIILNKYFGKNFEMIE